MHEHGPSLFRYGVSQMDLLDLLLKSLGFLKTLAQLTETKVDDEIVELLDAIAESPALLDWIKGLLDVGLDEAGQLSLVGEPPEAVALALKERKIDWAKLLEKLPAIISLFMMLSDK